MNSTNTNGGQLRRHKDHLAIDAKIMATCSGKLYVVVAAAANVVIGKRNI